MTGARTLETHIYKCGAYPFNLIAPVTIIWKPVFSPPDPSSPGDPSKASQPSATPQTSNPTSEAASGSETRKRKRKGKEKETSSQSIPHADISRTVWIRSHPAVFDDIFSALQTTASLTLGAVRSTSADTGSKYVEIELADLRGQVNVFEIMGPKSNQVIKGALTPVAEDKREEFKKVCIF